MINRKFAAAVLLTQVGFAGTALAESKFDLEIEAIIASDSSDTGLTYTDHDANYQINVKPTYDIFYATLFAENVDYGPDDPTKNEIRLSIGATPEFGDLSIDLNLQRRWKPGEEAKASSRWLPYVTATYAFSEQFSADLGVGYYVYDKKDVTKSFWELFAAVDFTPIEGLALHAETSYDPNFDFDHSDYLQLIGSATVTLPYNFEVVGKVGHEHYMGPLPSYTWYEAQLNYNYNEHVTIGFKARGSDLNSAECPDQAYTDCATSVFASLTLRGKLSDLSK